MSNLPTSTSPSTAVEKIFHTLITTVDYVPGVVCLAQSLQLVGSEATLLCWCSDEEVQAAVKAAVVTSNITTSILPLLVVDAHYNKSLGEQHLPLLLRRFCHALYFAVLSILF
jgi:hypothetical protein